jgi:antirestriction protein ArdC
MTPTARTRTAMINRTDLYRRVTDRIVADLEQGVRPWAKPWHADTGGRLTLPRRHNGQPSRGINILLL